MSAATSTRLRLDAEHTTLATDSGHDVVLAVGVQTISKDFFRHEPPSAFDMERAIDAIEDALTSSRLPHAERGELVTSEPLLQAWASSGHPPGTDTQLSLDEVEAIFQRLASASLGHPGALIGLPQGRAAAAAMLILRECMHHLGFNSVRILSS